VRAFDLREEKDKQGKGDKNEPPFRLKAEEQQEPKPKKREPRQPSRPVPVEPATIPV
jgi:hypothetical protein